MKTPIIILACWLVSSFVLAAQTVLYEQDFSAATIPVEWVSNTSTTQLLNNVPSDYSGASGGNNLFMANCQPVGQSREVIVQDLDTRGYGDLEISFGHRRTGAFDVAVNLDWSPDGYTWTPIAYSTPGEGSWSVFNANLPAGAENQETLFIRWSWITDYSGNCTTATPNYRIDDFTLTASTILPVNLLAFRSARIPEGVHLSFTTASELNNSHFNIERSTDGRSYQTIGRVEGKGTTEAQIDYEFIDEKPQAGWNYYRLKQVDYDGASEYFGPVSVFFDKRIETEVVKVYPTTVADQFTLEVGAELGQSLNCSIFNANGQVLRQWDLHKETVRSIISVRELTAGTYCLRWQVGSEQGVTRFVKL